MEENRQKVIVIGGGIAGLTAAYYLQKEARENNKLIDITIIEASARLGGKIRTLHKDGYIIERGADSFLERKENVVKLIKEVGLEETLVNNTMRRVYVLAKARLHSIQEGIAVGEPFRILPFVFSRLLSPIGKIRAGFDFLLPRSVQKEDQSIGEFFRRRFGDDVVDHVVEPLMSQRYGGDIDNMSLMSTFPKFSQLEQTHGSIVRGIKVSVSSWKKERRGAFATLTNGLESLVQALEAELVENSVIKSTRVDRIEKLGQRYRLKLSNGDFEECDAVVVATPHGSVPKLLSQYKQFDFFKRQPATSVATVVFGFSEEVIPKNLSGTGFVVSRDSDCMITACNWTHKKWPHTTPQGKSLLSCYVGHPGEEYLIDQSDEEIIEVVLEDLRDILKITVEPEFAIVSTWKEGMPQYTVGHKERMEKLKKFMNKELEGVYLVGSSFDGLGIPDCIRQGEEAAGQVLEYLESVSEDGERDFA